MSDARKRLDAAAQRFARAQAARDAAFADLEAEIVRADVAGMKRTEIIDVSGVARATVYRALAERPYRNAGPWAD
jgi:CRP-like cAMP-binding protein